MPIIHNLPYLTRTTFKDPRERDLEVKHGGFDHDVTERRSQIFASFYDSRTTIIEGSDLVVDAKSSLYKNK